MRLIMGILIIFLLLALDQFVFGQQPQSTQDQLALCQSLLRVKQDLPCRCDQAEQMAAILLKRAEKAEKELEQFIKKNTEPETPLGQNVK